MKNEDINQVFVNLAPLLPKGWQKLVFHASVYPDDYDMFFYVKYAGEYIQCYDLPKSGKISEGQINYCFEQIYKSLAEQSGDFMGFTLVITPDMQFTADMEYDDTKFDIFDWEDKYIKQG